MGATPLQAGRGESRSQMQWRGDRDAQKNREEPVIGTGKLRNAVVTPATCLTIVGLVLAMAPSAQARVTRIAVEKKVSPAFDGASFGSAGQYETLAGKAFGELDPDDPHNAVIQDIKLAPRNSRGMVEYTA